MYSNDDGDFTVYIENDMGESRVKRYTSKAAAIARADALRAEYDRLGLPNDVYARGRAYLADGMFRYRPAVQPVERPEYRYLFVNYRTGAQSASANLAPLQFSLHYAKTRGDDAEIIDRWHGAD